MFQGPASTLPAISFEYILHCDIFYWLGFYEKDPPPCKLCLKPHLFIFYFWRTLGLKVPL